MTNPTGATGHGSGYSEAEVDYLLNSIKEVVPVSGEEWGTVLAVHNTRFNTMCRNENGLKQKFQSLVRHKIPTGEFTNKIIWSKMNIK